MRILTFVLLCALTSGVYAQMGGRAFFQQPRGESTSLPEPAVYTQDFDDLSTGVLTGQGLWVTIDGAISVNDHGGSNAFDGDQTGYNAALYSASINDDQYSEVVAYVIDYSSPGPAVRMNSASGGTYYAWFHELSTATRLVKVVNGTATILVNGTTGWTDGDVVRLEVEGTELRCYKNGSLDTSVSGDGKFIDASISTGYTGVMNYYDNNNAYGHTWEGGSL